jgi:DUF4097 and DUF4098 domain-containing protein YvlB
MEQTFDTPGRLQLELRVPAGSIRVRAEQTSQTRLSISGERDPEDFRIVFDDRRSAEPHLTIEHRERGKLFGWRGAELRVDLTVPLGTIVACDTGSADLEITGLLGSLTFRSGSGDCRFDDVEGEVTVKGASGDLAGATVGGGLVFTSAAGDARVREIGGDVNGKSVSGDVSLGRIGGSVQLATVSGDVEIGSVSVGSASVRSVSGDVEIGVARGTRVYLDISSTSGDTVSELDMSDAASAGGGSDLELQVNSVSGDIRIVRAAAASVEERYAAEDSASSE